MTAVSQAPQYKIEGFPGSNNMMPVGPSPPESPSCQPFIPWETRTGQDQQCSQNSNLRRCNPAKEAVMSMGFPEQLVQLAIDLRLLDHGTTFSSAEELFLAAEYLCENLEKQADGYKRLHEHAQKQVRDVPSPISPCKEVLASKPKHVDNKEVPLLEKHEVLEKPPFLGKLPSESTHVGSARLSAEMSKDAVTAAAGNRSKIEKKVKDLAQENKRLKERKMCRACYKVELANSGITFLPCGHFITCETCSELFDDCPACGKNIMGTVRTFLS